MTTESAFEGSLDLVHNEDDELGIWGDLDLAMGNR
jgi:hypothetical protein